MSDPDHRPLMVYRDLVEVGSGAACTSDGHIWVLDFGTYQGVNDPTLSPPTATPEPPTATATSTATAAASKTSMPAAQSVETPSAAVTAAPDGATGTPQATGVGTGVGTTAAAGATATPGVGGTAGSGRLWIGLFALVVLGVVGVALKWGAGG